MLESMRAVSGQRGVRLGESLRAVIALPSFVWISSVGLESQEFGAGCGGGWGPLGTTKNRVVLCSSPGGRNGAVCTHRRKTDDPGQRECIRPEHAVGGTLISSRGSLSLVELTDSKCPSFHFIVYQRGVVLVLGFFDCMLLQLRSVRGSGEEYALGATPTEVPSAPFIWYCERVSGVFTSSRG